MYVSEEDLKKMQEQHDQLVKRIQEAVDAQKSKVYRVHLNSIIKELLEMNTPGFKGRGLFNKVLGLLRVSEKDWITITDLILLIDVGRQIGWIDTSISSEILAKFSIRIMVKRGCLEEFKADL